MFELIGGMFSRLDFECAEMVLRKDEIGRRFLIEVEEKVPPKKPLSVLLFFMLFMANWLESERDLDSNVGKRGKRRR
jgi:hypothetical protein